MKKKLSKEKLIDFLKNLIEKEDHYLEFWLEIERGIKVEKREHKIFKKESFEDYSLTIRYFDSKEKCGLSFTTSLEFSVIKEAYQKAKNLATYGITNKFPEGDFNYPELKPLPFKKLEFSEIIDLLEEAENKALKFHPSISQVERCNFEATQVEYLLLAKNRELFWERPSYTFSISVVAEGKEKKASSFEWNTTVELENLEIFERTKLACQKALALSKTKKGKSLKVGVILPPFVAINFLEVLSFSFLGDEVLKGRSFLKDKLGQKVFSEKVTLYDDGINPSLFESRPFDDEGVPQNKKVLVEKGVIKQFLFNTYWGEVAKNQGLEKVSLGNARRETIDSLPKIAPTNFYLERGESSPEDLLKREKEVLEILETLGTHTINPISGDFSLGISGIYYLKGEPLDYFCEVALSGNLWELFSKIVEVGKDLKFYGNIGSPTLLIEKLDLGG